MTKTRTLARGSLLRMCNFFLNAGIAFAMMPFVIHSLGDKMYGLWIFIGSFLELYGLFDLGFGSAVQRYVSRAIGTEDYKEANKIINTSLFLFSIIAIVIIIFSLLAAYLVPVFIKNVSEVSLFRFIVVIMGISFALSFPMKAFSGILTAHLRYDLLTTIGITKLILRTILIIIFFKMGYGIVALAFITLFTDLLGYILHYSFARNVAKYIQIRRNMIVFSKIKMLFSYGILTFVNFMADKLRFGIDSFVITAFMGLSFVTLYSIASRLILYFIDFISTALGIMTPVFSQYESKGDYDSIREKFILTTKISSYLSFLIGGILIIFGRAFILRWVGKDYLGAYPILTVLTIPVIFALMQSPSVQLVYGISKHKFYAVSNSIEGITNLILSIILVKKMGLIGVALGTAIPMVVIKLFVQPVYTCRIIKINIADYYLNVIGANFLKSLVVLASFWFIIRNLIAPNYPSLLIQILSCLTLFSFAIFFVGLKHTERGYFRKILAPGIK